MCVCCGVVYVYLYCLGTLKGSSHEFESMERMNIICVVLLLLLRNSIDVVFDSLVPAK